MCPLAAPRLVAILLVGLFASSSPGLAKDADGPNDCLRTPRDFGDAPEGVEAYPGVTGRFPTCVAPAAPGTQEAFCAPPGSAPGATGFVAHFHPEPGSYWLGCPPAGGLPMGIDSEINGKMNASGAFSSACDPDVIVDCVEPAFGLSFGQDECYGSDDAGVAAAISFETCTSSGVDFTAFNCTNTNREVTLNILVDWNEDGDWNDAFLCGTSCAPEWAVKNALVVLTPGCNTITSPSFTVGPNPGRGWMRITISDHQVGPDFPWNGSAGMTGQALRNGETEDYPILLQQPPPCPDYEDWGDAPEEVPAYPGVLAHFPTCSFPSGAGTVEAACLPISSPPGPTGYVRHVSAATDILKFWLGCGPGISGPAVDGESDGKTNATGDPLSVCAPGLAVDCTEYLGLTWGQDECYGDGVDAGVDGPRLVFHSCEVANFRFKTFNCTTDTDAFLNILVDMNEDGDWNDNFLCPGPVGSCAFEWAVKNVPITLSPGCQSHLSPPFLVGPRQGKGWLRITITAAPVDEDFPWNGSAGTSGTGAFRGGETEDYPVVIRPPGVGVDDPQIRGGLWLAPVQPNPAKDEILVHFAIPEETEVSLAVYDVAGRKLADLIRGPMSAGEHRVTWNFRDASGRELGAGYYAVRLRVGDRVLTQGGMRMR